MKNNNAANSNNTANGYKKGNDSKAGRDIKPGFYVLMFLPLAVTLIALFSLPDKIPGHFGADGLVTRYGSKYETLLLPVITVPFGYFMMRMAIRAGKPENKAGRASEHAIIIISALAIVVFHILTYYFLYLGLHSVENLRTYTLTAWRILIGVPGVVLIAFGMILPKLKRYSRLGLRTKGSLSSEAAWDKTQRFTSAAFVAAGATQLPLNILMLENFGLLNFNPTIILLALLGSIFYSHRATKAENE